MSRRASHNSFARPDEQMSGKRSWGRTSYNKACKKIANARRRRRDRGIGRYEL